MLLIDAPAVPRRFDRTARDGITTSPRVEHMALAAQAWVAQCTARLRQLRPQQDHLSCLRMASSLWRDVSAYDPRIAAEMEHESWLGAN